MYIVRPHFNTHHIFTVNVYTIQLISRILKDKIKFAPVTLHSLNTVFIIISIFRGEHLR